jgi:hypothetical protein
MTYSSLEGGNETSVDEYWESLDTGAIVVALDHEYTDNHGLARSVPFPWDDEKGLYHIKAFHQLHCLVKKFALDDSRSLICILESNSKKLPRTREVLYARRSTRTRPSLSSYSAPRHNV